MGNRREIDRINAVMKVGTALQVLQIKRGDLDRQRLKWAHQQAAEQSKRHQDKAVRDRELARLREARAVAESYLQEVEVKGAQLLLELDV